MISCRFAFLIMLCCAACSFKAPEKGPQGWSTTREGFDIYKTTIRFAHTDGTDAGSWTARATVNFEICLVRTFGWRQLEPDIPFQIQVTDAESGGKDPWHAVSTTPNGCVEFVEPINYPYAEKLPHYFRKFIRVRGLRDELQDLLRLQTVFLDPWNQVALTEWNEKQNGYPDPGRTGPLQIRVQNLAVRRIQSREISVDRSLGLQFRIPYLITLEPQLVRLGALGAQGPDRPSWEGMRFVLRGALVAPDVIGGFETEAVSDKSGQISAEVVLSIALEDLRFFESRPRLLLDLIPLSTSQSAPEGTSVVLSIDPRQEQMVYSTSQSPKSATDTLNLQAANFTAEPAVRGSVLKTYIRNHEVFSDPIGAMLDVLNVKGKVLRVNVDAGTGSLDLNASDVKEAIFSGKVDMDFLKHFSFLYSREPYRFPGATDRLSDYDFYLERPTDYVKWVRFVDVKGVEANPVQILSEYDILNAQANLYKQVGDFGSKGQGARTASTIERGDNRSIGFNSLGSGRNWYWSYQGRDERFTLQDNFTEHMDLMQRGFNRVASFYIDRLRLTLKGDFQRCLLLAFRPGRSRNEMPSYLFCAKNPGDLTESYSYVTDDYRTNVFSFLDFRNLRERQLLKIFRGDQGISDFVELVNNSTLNLELSPTALVSGQYDMRARFADIYHETSAFPGLANLQYSPAPIGQDQKIESLSQILAAGFGPNPQVNADQLAAYFNLVRSNPHAALGTVEGQQKFSKLGELIVQHIEVRGAYFNVLNRIFNSLDKEGVEGKWLYNFAERTEKELDGRR